MQMHTIGALELWLDRAAREHPEASAVDGVSYVDLNGLAVAYARGLANAGVGPGDRVATLLPPSFEFAAVMHALPKIGAVLVPVNTRLTAVERDAVLADAQPRMVLTGPPASSPEDVRFRRDAEPDEVHSIVYTSGTTGSPRAVELTYGNHEASALASAQKLGADPGDRWLSVLPVFHVGGLAILIRSAIYGTEAILHDGFDVERVKRSLESGEATLVSLVATQLRRLLDAGLSSAPALRCALIGGGPIPSDLLDRCRDLGINALPTYGMTETASQIWTDGPLPGVDLRIAPDGEILVRGPMVSRAAIAADGWLHTGDQGALEDGRLRVDGRMADTIVTGGENVSVAEVEEALLSHPAVRDAAVVGRPDAEWGQVVTAFVVTDGDVPDLGAHLRERLAGYKVPKQVKRIAEVPRNAAGKILRGRLP
jgi:O-succinylbenzoic acid--CoA ligase